MKKKKKIKTMEISKRHSIDADMNRLDRFYFFSLLNRLAFGKRSWRQFSLVQLLFTLPLSSSIAYLSIALDCIYRFESRNNARTYVVLLPALARAFILCELFVVFVYFETTTKTTKLKWKYVKREKIDCVSVRRTSERHRSTQYI